MTLILFCLDFNEIFSDFEATDTSGIERYFVFA